MYSKVRRFERRGMFSHEETSRTSRIVYQRSVLVEQVNNVDMWSRKAHHLPMLSFSYVHRPSSVVVYRDGCFRSNSALSRSSLCTQVVLRILLNSCLLKGRSLLSLLKLCWRSLFSLLSKDLVFLAQAEIKTLAAAVVGAWTPAVASARSKTSDRSVFCMMESVVVSTHSKEASQIR